MSRILIVDDHPTVGRTTEAIAMPVLAREQATSNQEEQR